MSVGPDGRTMIGEGMSYNDWRPLWYEDCDHHGAWIEWRYVDVDEFVIRLIIPINTNLANYNVMHVKIDPGKPLDEMLAAAASHLRERSKTR